MSDQISSARRIRLQDTAVLSFAPLAIGANCFGDMGHLVTENVVITLLCSTALLLTGLLLLMRRFRALLERTALSLTKSERQIRLMGDNLPNLTIFQLICGPDKQFHFTYLSKGYEAALGFDRDDVMNNARTILDQVYEKDLPLLETAFKESRNAMVAQDFEIRMLDVSGRLKWLHIAAVPHREDDLLIWDGFVQDISANRYMEDALLEENRNFQNLFKTIDDLLIVCDMNGRLLHTNPSVEHRLGYSEDDLKTMSIFELYASDARNEIYQIIARMQSEKSTTCGRPLQTAGGSKIPVEMNVFQGTWRNTPAIFGVARDIAARQQTETALRESQQMLQLIMNTIHMSVFWKDKDSVYLGCNRAFFCECGLDDVNEVIGKTPHDLFSAETAGKIIDRDQKVIHSNEPIFNLLESHTRKDGSIGWREISKIPLRNDAGQAVGVLGVWRDVTEQNQAEERLKRTLEDMERFNQLMRGRERRTLELKSEINQLLKELDRPRKYRTTTEDIP